MKKFQFNSISVFIAFILLIISSEIFAQDKKDDCSKASCDKKTDKVENSKMDQGNMSKVIVGSDSSTTTMTAKEVDTKLEAWNTVCPVKGNKIDLDANKVEFNGKVYGFCCNGCDSKFIKDPVKYSKNLSEDGKTFMGTK